MLTNLKNSSKRICGRRYCSLSSKTVLITGASSGIGEATARILAGLGMNVVLAARREKELERIVKEIKEKGGNAVGIPTDITKEEDQKKSFQEASRHFPGGPNYIIACAGIEGNGKDDFILNDDSIAHAQEIIKTDIIGTLITLKEGVKSLRKLSNNNGSSNDNSHKVGGVIILLSSGAGALSANLYSQSKITEMSWGYSPSKSYLDQLVRNSASLTISDNIRVYSVAPHVYRTEMAERVANEMGMTLEEFTQVANPIYPGKPGDPCDLVKVLIALLDNSSYYKPGDLIYCDNDMTYLADARNNIDTKGNLLEIDKKQIRDFRGKFTHQHLRS